MDHVDNLQDVLVTAAQMLRRGLRIIGVKDSVQQRRKNSTNIRMFRSNFGAHPNHCASIWRDLVTSTSNLLTNADLDLQGFFMALNFLRVYQTEDQRAPLFGNIELNDMRARVWFWVNKIASLKESVIYWPDNWGDDVLIITIDGTHFRVCEPRHPEMRQDPKVYSFKHKTAGFNVQVAMSIRESRIVHIFVSRGGQNDPGNLLASGLLDLIPNGKRAIVDGGYANCEKLSGYNQFESDFTKDFKKRAKARQETVNKRLKDWNVLDHRFRHGVPKFESCFTSVAVLTQYSITDTDPESANPIFDV